MIGLGEAARKVACRAGEGAALMTEQFGLDQGFGDGRAIDGDEGSVGAALSWWTAEATGSFPVPVSPVTRTVASLAATLVR